MKTYAAIYENNVRNYSSSGGVFSKLTDEFDIVYGVSMSEDCYYSEMIRVEIDLAPIRGSKYFQAKMGDSFKQVKEDLISGKKVLFSGTGCQVNGLKLFLNHEYENLSCIDVVCHGVPSPALWKRYVEYQETTNGKLKHINFRCKDDSWREFEGKYSYLYVPKDVDPFTQMFLRNYCLRPSCYNCPAKKVKLSDISIGDFWGIENVAEEMNDGKGTSLVITRTSKGQKLFESICGDLKWKQVKYEEAVRENPAENKSVSRPSQRDVFFDDMKNMPFEKLLKKYIEPSIKQKIKRKLKKTFIRDVSINVSNEDYGILYTFENNDEKHTNYV